MGVAALAAAPAAAQFSAQPVIVEMRPGDESAWSTFAVRNEADELLQLRIYAADFDQTEDGSHRYMEPGTHPHSCGDRLRYHPDDLLLDEHESADVRVRMEPGASTCWSMIFVQSVRRSETGMRIAQRIGIKVYGLGDAGRVEGEIASVAVIAEPGAAGRSAIIDFVNRGDGPVRPEGGIELRTENGEVVAVVPVAPFSVLPGRVRRTTIPLDTALPPGRYLAIPVLDFGGDYLAGGQAAFRVGG